MKAILYILSIVLLSSCINARNYQLKKNPPNGIQISENFYCDQTEITNFHWMEYLHYTGKVFGNNSQKYRAILPDTNVWKQFDTCQIKKVDFYLRHPIYRDFPVVGITQHQAREYSSWRSDRVFEYLLVKLKIIEENTNPTSENYFTIERFFNNEIPRLKNTQIEYYPEFRLPNAEERKKALHFSDSIAIFLNDKYYPNEEFSVFPDIHCFIAPCNKQNREVTVSVEKNSQFKKYKLIADLRGNVSEWAFEDGVVYGGSWNDKCEDILKTDSTVNHVTPTAWIGFRNVVEWKKWGN